MSAYILWFLLMYSTNKCTMVHGHGSSQPPSAYGASTYGDSAYGGSTLRGSTSGGCDRREETLNEARARQDKAAQKEKDRTSKAITNREQTRNKAIINQLYLQRSGLAPQQPSQYDGRRENRDDYRPPKQHSVSGSSTQHTGDDERYLGVDDDYPDLRDQKSYSRGVGGATGSLNGRYSHDPSDFTVVGNRESSPPRQTHNTAYSSQAPRPAIVPFSPPSADRLYSASSSRHPDERQMSPYGQKAQRQLATPGSVWPFPYLDGDCEYPNDARVDPNRRSEFKEALRAEMAPIRREVLSRGDPADYIRDDGHLIVQTERLLHQLDESSIYANASARPRRLDYAPSERLAANPATTSRSASSHPDRTHGQFPRLPGEPPRAAQFAAIEPRHDRGSAQASRVSTAGQTQLYPQDDRIVPHDSRRLLQLPSHAGSVASSARQSGRSHGGLPSRRRREHHPQEVDSDEYGS